MAYHKIKKTNDVRSVTRLESLVVLANQNTNYGRRKKNYAGINH